MKQNSAALAAPVDAQVELLQDRYRIERQLGSGGMGEVLLALDQSTGCRVALKRLLPGAKPRHVMLLQREFHTLIGLSHPHVVKAHDYGTSEGVPFYTMELLSGSDVDALAPLPWPEVAGILRDVASALALIHARHIVHRDVTARNVWRTEQGVIKLIDFGALSSFGDARDVAGTPPFIAPEVLRTRVLDQRTDLYSLGALGYFLLTGRHAYPARSIADLEQHWSEALTPIALRVSALERPDCPAVPEPLERLIEALLEAEPGRRPASAADVLDGLAMVLPESPGSRPLAVQGVLASKLFVGHESELLQLRAILKQTISSLGTSVALMGPQGAGRTRLIGELAVEARVAGASVLVVPADGDRTALSAAVRCAQKLLENLPVVARKAAVSRASVLGHLSPSLREQLGIGVDQLERFPDAPGEARMRLSAALSAWWLEVARERPMVILLDDLQDMDEASASLFAALARQLGSTRLLLVGSVRTDSTSPLPHVLQAFASKALRLELGPLSEQNCLQMLRSMFGNVEHLARSAQRLWAAAEGNPGRIAELAEYLVRNEAVRHIEGAWVLPQDIANLPLPDTQSALDEARASGLSLTTRSLARVLSVAEGVLSLELCGRLSALEPGALFTALEELVTAGMLVGVDDGYRFRREAVRLAIQQELSPEQARRAHALVGELLLNGSDPSVLDRVMAGVHFLRSGDARGASTINHAACAMVDDLTDNRPAIAPFLEQALPLLRAQHGTDHELMPVLCGLTTCGYFVERRLGLRYGPEALERCQRALGMDRARRLRRFFGRKLGLYLALIAAAVVFRRRGRKNAAVPSFAQGMRLMFVASTSVAGMSTLCVDRLGAHAAAQAIEPMTGLGPDHVASIAYRFGMGCAATVQDKLGRTAQHWQELMTRLESGKPVKGMTRQMGEIYLAGSMYAYGGTECWRDDSRALELADRLAQQPLHLYRLSAEQLRAVYHGQQGNSRLAAQHRARVEVHALQRGMTWQVEIWNPSSSVTISARHHDAMGAKQAAEQLRHLSVDTPSLAHYVHTARATYLLLRERFAEAADEAKQGRALRDPELVGATNALAQLAQAYNGLGKHTKAHDVCTRALADVAPEDLVYSAMMLRCQIELAHAESGLGNHQRAGELLDALLARHASGNGPLTLGSLHEARAKVAARAGEQGVATLHYAEMERWYRGTGSPPLIRHCERIARERRPLAATDLTGGVAALLPSGMTSIKDTQEAPEQLLTRAVRESLAVDGLLFQRRQDRLACLARTNEGLLSSQLLEWVEMRMGAALTHVTETDDQGDALTNRNRCVLHGTSFQFSLLLADDGVNESVVGALVVSDAMRSLSRDALHNLASFVAAEARPTDSLR